MKEQIIVAAQPSNLTFTMSGPSGRFKDACLNCADAIAKSNIDYEITFQSFGLVSFSPFAGLGNAWGSKFGFTFGCGPYCPSEGVLQNGLFAVAKFFENIQYLPYENASGKEPAAEASHLFSMKIAEFIRGVGLDVGRPVFPMTWTLTEDRFDEIDTVSASLVVTVTPRITASFYGSTDDTNHTLSPREVLNAIVFYASCVKRYDLAIGHDLVHVYDLMRYAGVRMDEDAELHDYQANAVGPFSHRWSVIDLLDTESESVFAPKEVMEKIDGLLAKRSTCALAANVIVSLMDEYCQKQESVIKQPAATAKINL